MFFCEVLLLTQSETHNRLLLALQSWFSIYMRGWLTILRKITVVSSGLFSYLCSFRNQKKFLQKRLWLHKFPEQYVASCYKNKKPKSIFLGSNFCSMSVRCKQYNFAFVFLSIIKTYNVFFIGIRHVQHLQVYNRQNLKLYH